MLKMYSRKGIHPHLFIFTKRKEIFKIEMFTSMYEKSNILHLVHLLRISCYLFLNKFISNSIPLNECEISIWLTTPRFLQSKRSLRRSVRFLWMIRCRRDKQVKSNIYCKGRRNLSYTVKHNYRKYMYHEMKQDHNFPRNFVKYYL